MRLDRRTLPHWILFGASLAGAFLFAARAILRLHEGFVTAHINRDLLAELLVLTLAACVLLGAAGWAYANRPRPPARQPFEGYTFG